jgi:hypothetical protein
VTDGGSCDILGTMSWNPQALGPRLTSARDFDLGGEPGLNTQKSDSDRLALGPFELALAGNYNHKIKMGYGRIALGIRMFDVTWSCTSIQCVPMAVLC